MFKVIGVDNLNRDYSPQRQFTLALDLNSATKLADTLNNLSAYNTSIHHKVVPAEQPLDLQSQYDLVGETMPYFYWSVLTGAEALPEHVAKYWYETTILNKLKA